MRKIIAVLESCFVPLFSDLVTELLGSDLMEHNILHSGIGIDEALDILNRNINYCRDDCFTL